jgi:hypothetical protein
MSDQGFDINDVPIPLALPSDDIPSYGDVIQDQISSDEEFARGIAEGDGVDQAQALSDYEDNPPNSPSSPPNTPQQPNDDSQERHRQERDNMQHQSDSFKKERDQAIRDRDSNRRRADQEQSARLQTEQTLSNVRADRDYDWDKDRRLRLLGLGLLPPAYDGFRKTSMEDKINELIKKELNKETTTSKEKTDSELMSLVKTLIKKNTPARKSRKKKSKKKSVKKKSVKKKPKKKSVKKK